MVSLADDCSAEMSSSSLEDGDVSCRMSEISVVVSCLILVSRLSRLGMVDEVEVKVSSDTFHVRADDRFTRTGGVRSLGLGSSGIRSRTGRADHALVVSLVVFSSLRGKSMSGSFVEASERNDVI
jgi:hypothetical protein